MDVEYFRTLFDYNRWANARVLDRAVEVKETDYFGPHPGLSFWLHQRDAGPMVR